MRTPRATPSAHGFSLAPQSPSLPPDPCVFQRDMDFQQVHCCGTVLLYV